MTSVRRILLVGLVWLVVVVGVGPAQAADWSFDFKVRVIHAALQLAPAGLRAKLPLSDSAAAAAMQRSPVLTQHGRRDPGEHYEQIKRMMSTGGQTPDRVLAELAALTVYAMDKTTPDGPRAFFAQVQNSQAIYIAEFDGYHRVLKFKALLGMVKDVTETSRQTIEQYNGRHMSTQATVLADELATLFNLYVNVSIDIWTTLADEAGWDLGQPVEVGRQIKPSGIVTLGAGDSSAANEMARAEDAAIVDEDTGAQEMRMSDGLFIPTEGLNLGTLLFLLVNKASETGVLAPLTWDVAAATPDPEEFVFEDGVSVSGSDAQATADQLRDSNMTVDSAGVDKIKGLDKKALEALNKLGIDVKSARREFQGTRGGVKPGEIVTLGDVQFDMGEISTVTLGSREEKAVFMQIPETAMGAGNSGQQGHLNQKVVATVIGANVGGVKSCFERRLREIPDLYGRVFVEFTIGLDGAVREVKLLENTTGDQPFADCLVRQVRRLRFPPPEGGEVTFVFPFIFEMAF